jgi:cytochrome c5
MAGRLIAFNLFTCFAVGSAFGQTTQLVKMPFEFTIASKALPAGTYTFLLASGSSEWLQVTSAAGVETRARIATRLGGPSEFLQDGSLVFDKTGAVRVLCEVWMPGADGLLLHSLPKGHSREVLLLSDLKASPNLSGKAVYAQTCIRCHGTDGKGDQRADKFFNVTIPRLNSASVQGKSDVELRDIITKGSSAMPPVEVDESGFRHRLPAGSVDAVIAFMRTLKQ